MLLDKVSLGATRTPLRAGGGGAKAGVGAAELLASGMTVPSSCCPQPRQPQLRVERALVLAHAARPSQGLRPAARLSARRQRTVLHSPPTLLLPRHGTRKAEARSFLFYSKMLQQKDGTPSSFLRIILFDEVSHLSIFWFNYNFNQWRHLPKKFLGKDHYMQSYVGHDEGVPSFC